MKWAESAYWPLWLALLIGALCADPAHALRVNFQPLGDSDRITFSFDSDPMPPHAVRRVGERELAVIFEGPVWETESRPGVKDFPGKLVESIRTTDDRVLLTLKNNAFGFIRMPTPNEPQFVLQVYRDPIGARWRPPTPAPEPAAPEPDPGAETTATQPEPAQPATGATTAEPAPAQTAATATVPQAPAAQPNLPQPTQPQPAQPQAVQPQPDQPTAVDGQPSTSQAAGQDGERRPFFSVPYSVRTQVTPPGVQPQAAQPEAPQTATEPAPTQQMASPETMTGEYPSSNVLRFKAVNKSAEEVKFAELAGSAQATPIATAAKQPVTGAQTAAGPDAGPVVGGTVGGAVQTPDDGQQASDQAAGTGQVSGSVTSPGAQAQGQVAQPATAPTVGGQVSQPVTPPTAVGQVAQPVTQPVAPQSTTAPVASGAVSQAVAPPPAQVSGSVAPPPTVVQGAPPPEPTEEVAAQVAQTVAPPPESVADEGAADEPTPQPDATQAAKPAPATDSAQDPTVDVAEAQADDGPSAREEEIRNQLYDAQSMMFNRNLQGALPAFEAILKQRDIPDDIREETLFAVADIKKQLYEDDVLGNFAELSQAYIEAMNANLRSNRVPRALLNLGLLNLQVGNFPEAKAYFKILQERFPDDDNIPSISYYWGEYYYRNGEFKQAADQFQYLIQTYPEHQLVKEAAFFLADSLDRTGFTDQAFQIVDYIDKRWPDYYMENPDFLRLAGGIEMQLQRWQEAKDHFFTFYNINPEAEGADVVLARIGDIYLREGKPEAARFIYEKVIADYPDMEGSLIAKMRMAEEGIYDDPTMPQMGNVFDRPFTERPEQVYAEIVRKYPDSPLAPVAQLKLAMWHAFNKKYPDALAAAQDLIEKYPRSPLVDRARKLGDSVFVLATPGMVADERYGRVVRYWETYDFIGSEDTKVNDDTILNVATSYWKVGRPAEALELIQPYLQPKPVPGVSEQALGLAVNIYLDQLVWKEIDELVAMSERAWNLQPEQMRQLDYARAVSLQNLGEDNKALVLWAELAKDSGVDPEFRGYALYYMAKDAMERQDLRRVFVYAQESLALLLHTQGDPEKIKENVLMSIYATERSGRYNEALKWAKEYDRYIDVDNPEWASTRFKLARIYRKAGAIDEWKELLGDIIERQPQSLQAQLAQSALETYELEQEAAQFAPVPQ